MPFNLPEELLVEHSKANAVRITDWIGKDAARFKQLMHVFLTGEYRVVQRAAHVISIVAEQNVQLLQPHLGAMIARMQEADLPVAVKRNVVRVLQHQEIPEALHGPVMNTCFDLLADVKETIAVRAFSITVLANLAKHYPEIKQELKVVLEEALEQEPSPGIKNRALKTLKAL